MLGYAHLLPRQSVSGVIIGVRQSCGGRHYSVEVWGCIPLDVYRWNSCGGVLPLISCGGVLPLNFLRWGSSAKILAVGFFRSILAVGFFR